MKDIYSWDEMRAYDNADDEAARRKMYEKLIEQYNDLAKTARAFRSLASKMDVY